MNVAFIIQAHADPGLLARFVSRIYGHGDIFIHLDAKVDIGPFKDTVRGKAEFINNRRRVTWGSSSILEAYMNLLEATSNTGYDYYSLHSGADYPCRPLREYIDFLKNNRGEEFIDYQPMPESFKYRYRQIHLGDFYKTVDRKTIYDRGVTFLARLISKALPERKEFLNWPPYLGANWCTVSHAFAASALAYWRQNKQLRRYAAFCLLPEEWFMQTYGQAAGFAGKFSKHGYLRYVDWSAKGAHPANLREKDYTAILNSKAFFARKITPESDGLLDLLDAQIGYPGQAM